jgi:hypothetical protein
MVSAARGYLQEYGTTTKLCVQCEKGKWSEMLISKKNKKKNVNLRLLHYMGHVVAWLVEALCYKSKGRGFEFDEVREFFSWPNSSNRTMALESTQPLTKMSTTIIPGE